MRFAFKLCLALGIAHPDYLDQLLTVRQFAQWKSYYDAEPWGERRADYRELASLAMAAGVPNVELDWPYWDDPITAEQYQAEVEAIQATIDQVEQRKRNRTDDDRGQNQHST